MKSTSKCPKCSSTDILMIPGKVGTYGAGNNIITGVTTLSAVLVHRYVCCECGFSEEWIDLDDMPRLKKAFENRYIKV